MREGWKKLNLETLGFVGRGKSRHRPRNAEFLYDGPYPFVQTADVKAADYRITDYSQTYSEEGLKQSKLWPPNTLCITIAANIADAAILGFEGCFPDSIIGFIPDDKKSDVRFVKYLFDLLQVRIKQISQGAAQDNLSMAKLRTIKFDVPPLPTQRKIASILSGYDDLIENNLQRIKLLEEQAQLTYEEWFVRMKFPGHETAGFDDETELPEGWEKVNVGGIIKRVSSTTKIKASERLDDGSIPVVDQSRDFISGATNNETALINENLPLIIFGDHTRILKLINFPFARGADGTQVLLSKSKRMPQHLFYHTLLEIDLSNYHYARHFKFLKEKEIVIPSEKIAVEFEKIAERVFNLRLNLQNQNQRLKEARDLLLPRLMMGVVGVDSLIAASDVKPYRVDGYMEMEEQLGRVAEGKSYNYSKKTHIK